MASNGELLLKHTQKIIDLLKSTAGSTDADNLENLSSKFDAVYIHPVSFKFLTVPIFFFYKFLFCRQHISSPCMLQEAR